MQVSIEISLYPMDRNYSPIIREFIDRIMGYKGIKIKVQPMSTLIIGEYDLCMSAMSKEIKTSLSLNQTLAVMIKIINIDIEEL